MSGIHAKATEGAGVWKTIPRA